MYTLFNKAKSSERRYLRQIATAAFDLRTWDSDTRIGIISSETKSKRILCNLPFENQLFGYIHYCTEFPEIHNNLLPNTCNFHRKFPFIFSLHLSQNAQNVYFREANSKLKISQGSMPPHPFSVLAPSALATIFAGLILNCFRRACYYQWVILSIILCKRWFFFRSRKGCTFRIIQRSLFEGLLPWGPLKLKVHPPPKKLRTRLETARLFRTFSVR